MTGGSKGTGAALAALMVRFKLPLICNFP